MEIKRVLGLPKVSFLLLGPRGTGKSTLIQHSVKAALRIDLLKAQYFLPLSANPSGLVDLVKDLRKGAWVVIDEIQKIPALLDEVHSLYEEKGLHFALTGSSARKLRRQGANLLAGRALSVQLFPFTFSEYESRYSLDEAIEWGSLPRVVVDPNHRAEFLSSYVETYLREELVAEGLIRKLEPFARFLKMAGLYSSQTLNVENIAREAHLSRSTVQTYFEVLEDTLLGFQLPSFRCKLHSNEVVHPKFYLFDSGVARACSNLAFEDVDPIWLGQSFESLIINEVKAHNRYLKRNRDLFYYRYHGGYEIDLIIETKRKTLSQKRELNIFEIKNSKKWDSRWNQPLRDFIQKSKGTVKKAVGIYRGSEVLSFEDIQVLPAEVFLSKLSKGEFF